MDIAARFALAPNNDEILRCTFTSAGAKTLSVTTLAGGQRTISWEDSYGTQYGIDYSRTVNKGDYVVLKCSYIRNIQRINFGAKDLEVTYNSVINSLYNLIDFRLNANRIKGKIFNLSNTKVTILNLIECSLQGQMPILPKTIKNAYFGANNLIGGIHNLELYILLERFYINNNNIIGRIPCLFNNVSISQFYCYNNRINDYAGGGLPITLGDFQAQNNLLTQSAVDLILSDFVAAGRTSLNGTCNLNLGGTGNSAPSAAGIANRDILISRGWTVTTN